MPTDIKLIFILRVKILTEKQLEDIITQARNIMLAQNFSSANSLISFKSSSSYFFGKNLVCVAKRITARAEIQANALIPIRGLVVILVARLSAERALKLSNIPVSINPAVLLSAIKK